MVDAVRMARQNTLQQRLRDRTVAGDLVETVEGKPGWVRCTACAHLCPIPPGALGVCKVRGNEGGTLRVPHGYVAALMADPVEKKPFHHVLPGSLAMSFGMLGCDFHCGYCQNWITSQTLRDPRAHALPEDIAARSIVERALETGCRLVVSTYNEPLITAEWAREVFTLARAEGLLTGFVSNGNATPQVLDYLRPVTDVYKVDLKSFRDRTYRKLGGTLAAVTGSLRGLVDRGFWVEVVTLLVPGLNDGPEELAELTAFLADLDPDIPWHVTGFHSDYRMQDREATRDEALRQAAEIGERAGLRYVYAGNRPGSVGSRESTRCHACGELLVRRRGFRVLENRLRDGICPTCAARIPGVWAAPGSAGPR